MTGGGSGHLPTFLGFVGKNMVDGCGVGGGGLLSGMGPGWVEGFSIASALGFDALDVGGWTQVGYQVPAGRLMVLDDGIRAMCGHGPNTSIGVEKTHNPFVKGDM